MRCLTAIHLYSSFMYLYSSVVQYKTKVGSDLSTHTQGMYTTGSTKWCKIHIGKICMQDDWGGLVKLDGDNGGASHCLCSFQG